MKCCIAREGYPLEHVLAAIFIIQNGKIHRTEFGDDDDVKTLEADFKSDCWNEELKDIPRALHRAAKKAGVLTPKKFLAWWSPKPKGVYLLCKKPTQDIPYNQYRIFVSREGRDEMGSRLAGEGWEKISDPLPRG